MATEKNMILVELRAKVKGFQTNIKKATNSLRSINKAVTNFGKKFTMWALSTMFFGMLLQRTFMNIGKTALKTFKDIAGASSMQVQGLARLEAAWTFLKFSVGNALATALLPLIPAILRIVTTVSDWVNKNPELTAGIIGLGVALGSLLFVGSSLFLGMQGLAGLWGFLSKAIGPLVAWVFRLVGGFGILGSIGTAIWGVITAIAAAVGIAVGLSLIHI
jgi:hypothetical protein